MAMVSPAGFEHRLKKVEAQLTPASHTYVVTVCEDCHRAATLVAAREGDTVVHVISYVGCMHCHPHA
jgi:hypothetical protein